MTFPPSVKCAVCWTFAGRARRSWCAHPASARGAREQRVTWSGSVAARWETRGWREASRILWVATDALSSFLFTRCSPLLYSGVAEYFLFFFLFTPQCPILNEFIYLLVSLFSQNTTRGLSVLHLMCPQASKYIHQLPASISMFDYCNLHFQSPYSVWATLHASSHCIPGSTNKSSGFPPGFKFKFGAAHSMRPSLTQERT